MPAIFFRYELSPIKVRYTYNFKSMMDYFMVVFAIFGGFFTCAGIVEAMLRNLLAMVSPDPIVEKGK